MLLTTLLLGEAMLLFHDDMKDTRSRFCWRSFHDTKMQSNSTQTNTTFRWFYGQKELNKPRNCSKSVELIKPSKLKSPGTCYSAPEGFNCDGTCVDDNGNGICDVFELDGCTNPAAINYLEEATEDDGSCIFPSSYCGAGTVWIWTFLTPIAILFRFIFIQKILKWIYAGFK